MMKVLVSDPVSEKGVALLKEEFEVDVKTKLPVEELIRIIPEYDGLVVRSETKVTAPVLDAAVKLKVIGRGGRTAYALRTVVKVAAAHREQRVLVDIVDD